MTKIRPFACGTVRLIEAELLDQVSCMRNGFKRWFDMSGAWEAQPSSPSHPENGTTDL